MTIQSGQKSIFCNILKYFFNIRNSFRNITKIFFLILQIPQYIKYHTFCNIRNYFVILENKFQILKKL